MKQKHINGQVKWFDDAKGFGFIVADDKEYFVHWKGIKMKGRRTLVQGQKVTFDVEVTENDRVRATNVQVIDND